MSEKLASRLQQVLNAELVMMASIPLAASLMVRRFLCTSMKNTKNEFNSLALFYLLSQFTVNFQVTRILKNYANCSFSTLLGKRSIIH